MSSRCRQPDRPQPSRREGTCRPPAFAAGAAAALAALAFFLAATARAQTPSAYSPAAESGPLSVAVSGLFPGGGAPPPPDPHVKTYQGNPQYINEGHRLFNWFNCVGCHANGGGGMGPALMDNQWRYGGRLDQIYASITQGRPNGMPSWAGKIPDAQIWEIAAFVQSLSSPSPVNQGQSMPQSPPPPAANPLPPQSEAPGVATTPK
ncbi:MAG: c-type cytochrome [Alphaproteobacteria bacterium]|nr:c-type cytochrome [Alphaproteobacteria bacterium]